MLAREIFCRTVQDEAVFRIHDILGWIRIRGSMLLTNRSGFGSGSIPPCGSGWPKNMWIRWIRNTRMKGRKERTLAALMSSSARHSAMDLMFLKAASLAPVHSSQMA